ncbi:MAG: hypothetical protein ACRC4L_03805 [Mycoplasma sp.]
MKYIIYDTKDNEAADQLNSFKNDETSIINIAKPMAKCVGCFHCWLKNPGECKFKDKIQWIGKEIITSEEVIFICENLYGGFSSNMKRLIDRCIPGVTPFFRKENNELHHTKRYKTSSVYKIIFFNNLDVTDEEREHAKQLMRKVATNYHATVSDIVFTNDIKKAIEQVKIWKS